MYYWFTLILLALIAFFMRDLYWIAMWIGFAAAARSIIGNDFIQTIGTFLNSNKHVPWQKLWFFIGGIFVLTASYGYFSAGGQLDFGRLTKIPEVSEFTWIQILAPFVLIALTRLRMPVSTTFLVLATFASTKTISAMTTKSVLGYIVAFISAFIIWWLISCCKRDFLHAPDAGSASEKRWRIAQWTATAFLWSSWIMQDMANLVVFLPRSLTFAEFIFINVIVLSFLAWILRQNGGRIQRVVTEKTDMLNVKSATLIDFALAIILILFKEWSSIPMSTTWVFLGILAGREVVMALIIHKDTSTLKLISKDVLLATLGLLISVALVTVGRL